MPEKVTDDIWMFRLTALPNWIANAYLIESEELTLIDSGTPLNTRRIKQNLDELGYSPSDLDNILLTHYDLDHFGGILRLNHNANIYAGYPDAHYLSGEGKPPLLHHKGAFHRFLSAIIPRQDVTTLSDGEEIDGFRAIHTPGHNPGHMAYINRELDTAFLGDLVWQRNSELVTPFWFDSYELNTLTKSVKKLAEHPSSFNTACFGHGEPIIEKGAKDRLIKFAEKL